MSTTQQLISELEKQQQELELKLTSLRELEVLLHQKHKDNLTLIEKNTLANLNESEIINSNTANDDTLNISMADLKLETKDIEAALNEIFKI